MILLVLIIIMFFISFNIYEPFVQLGDRQPNYIYNVTKCKNCRCYRGQNKCCNRSPFSSNYSCKCTSKLIPKYNYFNSPWRPINKNFSIFGNLPRIGTYIEKPFNIENYDYLEY